MTPATVAPAAPALRPFTDIPTMGLANLLRSVVAGGGGRVDMLGTLRRMYKQRGPRVRQSAGRIRFVYLFGPDANRYVLLDRDRIFSARQPWMGIMGRIFPNGLLLRDGEEHRHHRRIMQEAFMRPALAQYCERMHPMIAEGIAEWGQPGGRLLAFPAFKRLTLQMAAALFLGVDLAQDLRDMKTAFEDMVAASMSRVRLRIPGLEFYRGLKGREYMIDFLRARMAEKRADRLPDMFSRLCHARTEEGETFEDQEIIDHMIFLMMAAHDTTTSTLTSMMYELALHPDWQERVREESRALGKLQPAIDELDQLTSLTLVMQETLRRYPALPVIPRIATADFAFEGYEIPRDTMIVVSPIHTHHMPEWWTDPYRFDPERFAPDRAEQDRHSHSWIPFGGGPHLCIGYRFAETQIRAIMHQIVQRFCWSVPDGYTMPVQQAPISKPRDGLPIRLTVIG